MYLPSTSKESGERLGLRMMVPVICSDMLIEVKFAIVLPVSSSSSSVFLVGVFCSSLAWVSQQHCVAGAEYIQLWDHMG